jgi:DNA modification methylase
MHQSETEKRLNVVIQESGIKNSSHHIPNVEFVLLPFYETLEEIPIKGKLYADLNNFLKNGHKNSTFTILTSPILAADFCAQLPNSVSLKLWIANKLKQPIVTQNALSKYHAALIVLTKYTGGLRHTKTRIPYTYCPICDKTTKDYGGKKHLYHEYGTLMSDVWRNITVNFDDYPEQAIDRLSDLFGLPEYNQVNVYDERTIYHPHSQSHHYLPFVSATNYFSDESQLLNGDCIEKLKTIPDNSIDFCFADPPYNLKKKYESWNDGIQIQEYFEWCDQWLSELARVLKPGSTLAVLNIPQWCIRHFKHLITILDYQDWIVWEGLSMPVRMIMPAHYSILCFSKGKPRQLPGLKPQTSTFSLQAKALTSLSENFCIRGNCIAKRKQLKIQDMEMITNLWHDIHRLKHNSRRVDHPCQLPPMFMYRLISLFTNQNEFVLDPFNGAGTTTLTAQELNRKYVGIEISGYYHDIATKRHEELSLGLNPFRKNNDKQPKVKNSRIERLQKQKYRVSKKVLQLEVREISKFIGHIPTKEEISIHSKYPLEYFENYFIDWGEVTAAARTTGMSETKNNGDYKPIQEQLRLFEKAMDK